MASTELLSTAANAFSVIGLADLVFKYGRQAYDALGKVHQAQNEVKELLEKINDVGQLVVQTTSFLEDFKSSGYPPKVKREIPRIAALLSRCQKEFLWIRNEARKAASLAGESWFSKLRKNTKWALGRQDIVQSCNRLERVRKEIDSALHLVGRQFDLSLQIRFEHQQQELASVQSQFLCLQKEVHVLGSGLSSFVQQNKTCLEDIRTSVAASQNALMAASETAMGEIPATITSEATQQRLFSNDNFPSDRLQKLYSFSKMIEEAECIEETTPQSVIKSGFLCTEYGSFDFDDYHLQPLTMPLIHLNNHLLQVLPSLISEGSLDITWAEARWMESELSSILGDCHTVSALDAYDRAMSSSSGKKLPERSKSNKSRIFDSRKSIQAMGNVQLSGSLVPSSQRRPYPQNVLLFQEYSRSTPAGSTVVHVMKMEKGEDVKTVVMTIRTAWIPHAWAPESRGFFASFSHAQPAGIPHQPSFPGSEPDPKSEPRLKLSIAERKELRILMYKSLGRITSSSEDYSKKDRGHTPP